MRKHKLHLAAFPLLIALMVCLFAGCGGAASDSMAESYYDKNSAPSATYAATTMGVAMGGNLSYTTDMELKSESIESGSGSIFVPADQRKIIRNAHLYLQTEDFSASYSALTARLGECGGYIEQINTSGSADSYDRYADMTLRVPADRLDMFLESRESFGSVRSMEIWQEDMTFNYTDMETRLATLETKKDRLLAMLEKATEMSDIIELETALSDTIYEIERYTSNLRGLQDKVSYSTVNLTLREVVEVRDLPATPKTLGEKIAARFSDTLEGLGDFGEELLIFVIGASPVLVLLAAIAVVIVLIVKKVAKKNRDDYNRYLAQYRKDIPADEKKEEEK